MKITLKQSMNELTPYEPGRPIEAVKEQYGLTEVIKLASNENPYGVSEKVSEFLAAPKMTQIYPDGHAATIRKAVSEHLQVDEDQLLFGAGSDEVILFLCRAMLGPGTNSVMATPSFSQYKHNATVEGSEVIEVPVTAEGDHDLERMLAAINEETRIVWVCNPNNPTGNYINDEEFVSFLERVPENVLVVSDEAYLEYVEASDYPSTLPLLDRFSNLLLLRTFSKMYGLANLRLGFAVGQADFIRQVEPIRPPFNTTTFAQEAAIRALSDQAFVQSCFEKNKVERDRLRTFFEDKGYYVFPSQTNFLLVDLKKNGNDVFQALMQKGIIIRSGVPLGFPSCIRVSLGTKEENDQFISAFEDVIV
ncbi:histidinol-phosphate aminotransferase [Geomicrobium sediminis]|uniref:Histidinol-phosphate aminotransferase n=1 Tax=Geomicrobium sediminis TaxID=1347788 RepID=A0ABS2PDL9_9BACL|nr:histidinol-phosphate aminotransferase [Geomicrobium sediminis]